MTFKVAIDGPAAAGKGTISKALAKRFGFAHLDTGLLYRAVGLKVLNGEPAIDAALSLSPDDLTSDKLRTAEVAQQASKVAIIPEVRAALVAFQKDFSNRGEGAVLDGRDIGTIICPNADVKLYVMASAEVRAKRRFDELTSKGAETSFEKVLGDVIERDMRDTTRADAPLRAAADAIVIDTSNLSIEAAIQTACEVVQAKRT